MSELVVEPVPPTLEQSLGEYLSDLGWWVTRTGTDLQALVAQHGAVIAVRRTGGVETVRDARLRVTVEVYAGDPAKLWTVADEVNRRLSGRSFRAGRFLIDRATNDGAPVEVPHPNLRVTAATYRVTTRTRL